MEEITKAADEMSEKLKSANLLLHLQKEMACMRLQLTKLQDCMRSTEAALSSVMDHQLLKE